MKRFSVDPVAPVSPSFRVNASDVKRLDLSSANIREGSVQASALTSEGLLRCPNRNSFLETILLAYDEHVPIVLGPDEVWVAMLQAVSKHIELFPEDSRKAIVPFEGRQLLEVFADDFVWGSSKNDWPRVFGNFSTKIEGFLGKKKDMFDPTFSTTTRLTKAVIQVQMMSALAPYFDYKVHTRCGIPSITLLGTEQDWSGIVQRVEAFGEFYPSWAHVPLLELAQEFLAAYQGSPTQEFWQNFVKVRGGSGGTFVSGYINALFPYMNGRPNHVLRGEPGGANMGDMPGSVSSVPVVWKYLGKEHKMRLATGIFGTGVDHLHSTGAYRPILGWVLGEEI